MLETRLRNALAQGSKSPLLTGDGIDHPAPEQGVPAAILMAITNRADPGLILTRRPKTMRHHPGQVAFPGGRIDEGDEDPVAAALREAEEEIALPRAAVRVIHTLAPYQTGTGYHITPVVAVIPPDLPLFPNDAEVAAIFEVPLSFVLDPANHKIGIGMWQGQQRRFYEMHWQGFHIWGATAAMIVNLERQLIW